jgi:hypothetical protein
MMVAVFGSSSAVTAQGTLPLPPIRPPELTAPSLATKPTANARVPQPSFDEPLREAIPLPPIRPSDLTISAPEPAPDTTTLQPTDEDNDAFRAKILADRRVIGEGLAPIIGPGGCGIAAPLQIDAIMLADGTKVALSPPVTLRASLASAVADWVRDDLAPAVAAKGDRLAGIEGTGGYECRGRNRIAGAKLSEHAIGNALDLQAFVTEHGRRLAIAMPKSDAAGDTQAFLRAFLIVMKQTACLRFATVLGPGADSNHAEHVHIDLEARRHGSHICQWNLQDETGNEAQGPPAPKR